MIKKLRIGLVLAVACMVAVGAIAEEGEEDRGWSLGAGLSFISTTGNSDTSSGGFTVDWERVLPLWKMKGGLSALETAESGETIAEKYRIYGQGDRSISSRLALTAGVRGERNRFAGIDLRTIGNLGLAWKAIDHGTWKVETSGSATWSHESQVEGGKDESNLGLLLSALSRYEISDSASASQALLVEPSIEDSDDFRVELVLALESSLTRVLAVKLGYNYRYDNAPVPGFEKKDTETTASLVVKIARGSYKK